MLLNFSSSTIVSFIVYKKVTVYNIVYNYTLVNELFWPCERHEHVPCVDSITSIIMQALVQLLAQTSDNHYVLHVSFLPSHHRFHVMYIYIYIYALY